jgi:putative CocE/NonD family hydrolase
LKFSPASLLDLNNLHREWYDWTLKAGPRPEFLKERVAYYVTGLEQWKYAPALEKIASRSRLLYLNSCDGKANDAFQSGSLEAGSPAPDSSPDHYVYDPLDLRPAELETEPVLYYLTDQRYVLNTFGNGLVYHSAPFEQEVEISGFVRLELWICLDVPDTDFSATLFEVSSDGSSIQLAQDLLRARYRLSLEHEMLVTPGEIERYVFDGFNFFSRRISRGSRLRLFINSPNSIYLQKNYNSGGVVISETAADARTAQVTLYHDAEHPSYLQIPLVE